MKQYEGFEAFFNTEIFDASKFREYCFKVGIPEDMGLRSTCWKFLLNYLSNIKSERKEHLEKCRNNYYDLVKDLILDKNIPCDVTDHPLNLNPDSSWNIHFQYYRVHDIINADCKRMRQDFSFFRSSTLHSIWKVLDISKIYKHYIDSNKFIIGNIEYYQSLHLSSKLSESQIRYEPLLVSKNHNELHYEVVKRILYIYAKTNSCVKYVQGMHDLVGTLYYVFYKDSDTTNSLYAEPDTFYCFTNLMSEIQESFIKTFDRGTIAGVGKSMYIFSSMLKNLDPIIHKVLLRNNVDPIYFSFHWIVLLFSPDFHLSELVPLWDTFLSDPNRFDLVKYCGISIVILLRDRLLGKDFDEVVNILKHYQEYISLRQITHTAKYLYAKSK